VKKRACVHVCLCLFVACNSSHAFFRHAGWLSIVNEPESVYFIFLCDCAQQKEREREREPTKKKAYKSGNAVLLSLFKSRHRAYYLYLDCICDVPNTKKSNASKNTIIASFSPIERSIIMLACRFQFIIYIAVCIYTYIIELNLSSERLKLTKTTTTTKIDSCAKPNQTKFGAI
jgi:hypothetical protein